MSQELAARITRLQRANHLLGAAIAGRSCNITDATPKVIAVAKVRANIVIHICSSIAWQAGAQPVSQPPAPGKEPQPMICTACAYYWRQATHFFAIRKTCHSIVWRDSELVQNSGAEAASCAAVRREAEEDCSGDQKTAEPHMRGLCATHNITLDRY